MPLTYFTIGPKTEALAEAYLVELKEHPEKAGARLRAFLNTETMMDWFERFERHYGKTTYFYTDEYQATCISC